MLMPYVNSTAPTSELEAVNAMRATIGLAPVADLGTTELDTEMAIGVLQAFVRKTLARRWRFNTEFGLEIAPAGTIDWTDRYGVTTTLNVFKAPQGMLDFRATSVPWQQGAYYLDATVRRSTIYQEAGAGVLVFYDRAYNREGFANGYLYINPVWLLPFEDLPETARQYCFIGAARRYAQQQTGSDALTMFTSRDEIVALRDLKKAEGIVDSFNIFDNASVRRILGGRPLGPSGFIDGRASTGR